MRTRSSIRLSLVQIPTELAPGGAECRKMITEPGPKKRVTVCDTQPITAEGLKNLLAATPDLEFLMLVGSLEGATAAIAATVPDLIVLDKGFGMRAVLDWIHDLKLRDAAPAITVWGVSMTEAEALRLLQAGG